MGLYLLIPTFFVILLSVLVVRAGAIALRMTGIDQNTANFQALSAFTRAGFTTRESELVMSHSRRRTIVTWLIILGNAGIVAVIVTGTSSLSSSTDYRLAINLGLMTLGLFIIFRIFRHTGLSNRWERFVENRLLRGRFMARVTVEHMLHLPDESGVARVETVKSLSTDSIASKLIDGKFILLGVEREGEWISAPEPYEVTGGDNLIIYGPLKKMEKIFKKGDVEEKSG